MRTIVRPHFALAEDSLSMIGYDTGVGGDHSALRCGVRTGASLRRINSEAWPARLHRMQSVKKTTNAALMLLL
jgi:hypothetical protein